jgi:hypothetical protein
MSEEWRQIAAFPDYAVSNTGRVMRVVPDYLGRSGGILKPRVDRYAYLTLYRERKPHGALVHRLVCLAFHGQPPTPWHEVAHNDGNPLNNDQGNLRWATRVENEADKFVHGTSLAGRPSSVPLDRRAQGATHGRHTKPERTARGERGGKAKLTEADVRRIRADQRVAREIAAELGVTRALVQMIKTKKIWRHV